MIVPSSWMCLDLLTAMLTDSSPTQQMGQVYKNWQTTGELGWSPWFLA